MPFIRSFSINTDRQQPFPFNIPAVRFARNVQLGEKVTIFVGDNEDFSDFVNAVDREKAKISLDLQELKGQVDDSTIERMSESMNYALHETRKNYGADMQAFSHGEAYLTILQNRILDKGIYLLDEPEAALSPLKQLSLLAFILEVLKKGSAQFIIATHSPILMGLPEAALYEIREDGMPRVEYKETDHYRITKRFLDNPESYLRHLR